jgi:hypothetical protein
MVAVNMELPKAAKIKTWTLYKTVRMICRMINGISLRMVAVAAKTMPKIKGGNGWKLLPYFQTAFFLN